MTTVAWLDASKYLLRMRRDDLSHASATAAEPNH